MPDFLQTVRDRVVIYDGAMGTNIQFRNPSVDDFWGKECCNELLVLSRPEIIKDIHAEFFQVGCDVVETNLLKPEENVGVRLTTGFLLEPEQSTSAIVVHHPGAKYFVV